ncbi:MAG TPA: hypothetical protein DCS93_42530 [Microscillaceae bacterium]|nr:hypothetical protein [Microscillaceae bacterium]
MDIVKTHQSNKLTLKVEFNTHDLTDEESRKKQVEAKNELDKQVNHYVKKDNYKVAEPFRALLTNPNRESRGRAEGEKPHVWYEAFIVLEREE